MKSVCHLRKIDRKGRSKEDSGNLLLYIRVYKLRKCFINLKIFLFFLIMFTLHIFLKENIL